MPPANDPTFNLAWVLLGAFLVMFMQAGFALVETGLTRAKNAAHTMGMNLIVYPVGVLGFWLVGYGLMIGGVPSGRRSVRRRAALGKSPSTSAGTTSASSGCEVRRSSRWRDDPPSLAMFLFQMVFMDTAATIPTGAMAERWKFSAFIVYGFFMSTVLYPLYGNWVWGGGWLSALGVNFGLGHRPRRLRRLERGAHDRRRHRAGGRDRARSADRQVPRTAPWARSPGTTSPSRCWER